MKSEKTKNPVMLVTGRGGVAQVRRLLFAIFPTAQLHAAGEAGSEVYKISATTWLGACCYGS